MSKRLSEQDLYALFEQLSTDDMPSGMATRIEQQVLTEVNDTLRPGVVTSGRGSGWFAQMFSNLRMPSLQLLPSFAMGAAAAAVIVALMLNPGWIDRLIGFNTNGPLAPQGESELVPTSTEVPTVAPTATTEAAATEPPPNEEPVINEVEPPTIEPTNVPESETPGDAPEQPVPTAVVEESNGTEDAGPAEQVAASPEKEQGGEVDTSLPAPPLEEVQGDGPSSAYPAPLASEGDETKIGGGSPTNNNGSDAADLGDSVESVGSEAEVPEVGETPTAATPPARDEIAQVPTVAATPTGASNANTDERQPTATSTPRVQATHTAVATSGTATLEPTPTSTIAITSPAQTGGSQTAVPTNTPRDSNVGTIVDGPRTVTPSPSPTPSLTPTSAATRTRIPNGGARDNNSAGLSTSTPTSEPTDTPTTEPTSEPTQQQGVIRTVEPTSTPKDTETPIPALTATGTNTPSPTATSTSVPTVNHPPVASDHTIAIYEDGEVVVDLRENITDEDGDSLSVSIMKEPDHGVLTIQNGSVVRYQPDANFNGKDIILVQVKDSNGLGDIGTVTFDIAPVNDLPEAISDNQQIEEDTPIVVDAIANDSDVDGDELSIVSVGDAQHGSVTIVDGKLNYVPELDFNGDDSFNYVISDGTGFTSIVTRPTSSELLSVIR